LKARVSYKIIESTLAGAMREIADENLRINLIIQLKAAPLGRSALGYVYKQNSLVQTK
jgi:hypothetical protein